MENLKLQYRDLEQRVFRALRELVENSTQQSKFINGKAISVNIFDYVELVLVDDRLTFLDDGGYHYSLYADCGLEDLIDLLPSSDRQDKIDYIKRVINDYGSFTTFEVEADCSPCVNSVGKFVSLAETFEAESVGCSTYEPDSFSSDSIDDFDMSYEDLTDEVINQIYELAQKWEEVSTED